MHDLAAPCAIPDEIALPAEPPAPPTRDETLTDLQARIGVDIRQRDTLLQALRHRSASSGDIASNERMEFLGDAIVGAVIAEYLYQHHREVDEGYLAKAKAYVVSEPVLAEAARRLGVDAAVELGQAEDTAENRDRASILSDAFEALIAAVFLDRGMRAARKLVRAVLLPALEQVERDEHPRDYKSTLQELVQADRRTAPSYEIVAETGAAHDRTFTAQVLIGRRVLGEGMGKSKKLAQQQAARDALTRYGVASDAAPPAEEDGQRSDG